MTSPRTVVLSNVGKSFGRTRALENVDLSAGIGVTGLLGRNGAGKTTLLRILGTVLAPGSGAVRLLGRDCTDPGARVEIRRQLGYLPQDPGLYKSFSAFDFVDYIAILKEINNSRVRHAEVRRVLDLVGLSEVAYRRIRGLSGGMRRRVGIAQALLGDPALLVLDEPTAGLDPEQRGRFLDVISRIGERSTVIMASQRTDDIASLCGQVAVLHAGRIRLTATATGLTETARGRVWASSRPDPRARATWRTSAGVVRNVGDPPAGAEVVEPDLEDAYLLLVSSDAIGVRS